VGSSDCINGTFAGSCVGDLVACIVVGTLDVGGEDGLPGETVGRTEGAAGALPASTVGLPVVRSEFCGEFIGDEDDGSTVFSNEVSSNS